MKRATYEQAGPLTKSVIRAIMPRGKYKNPPRTSAPLRTIHVYCAYCGRLVRVDERYMLRDLSRETLCPSGAHPYPLGESAAEYVRRDCE